ncbi:hypothetical protein [Paractinoplanes brasiliensis]|uniref:Uncharacterized protein n=1 Tax=Paractinoplanes brasiliensis TaxID=52695 RepID=A0A4R6JVW4_9ACTN|nr:hypothetical protein [Actinoplanes brasiliensis]TDO39296.1 hypothetical protein C8E87_2974 [Actinoplanes brasiliensis]GID30001.1 hypothetical protein Abr02nite_49840 [Actinoplanes brasiliensis]
MSLINRARWARSLLVAGVTVTVLTATTAATAQAAPAPAPPAQLSALAEGSLATYEQKLAVAVKFGLGDDFALLEKADRDFVIAIWNHVKGNPAQVEVRVAAETAFTSDPDLSYEFITAEVFAAFDRDVERERVEAATKRASDLARSAAAASIDVVADAALLNGSDLDFVRLIWERVADDAKWPKVKAAARAARDGSDADRSTFIATGMAEAARQDIDDRIAADEAKTEAEKAAERARASKKLAANRIGMAVTDELLNLPDRDFIIRVWNFTADGSEVQAAAIAATRSLDPVVWKAYIDTGLHQAVDRDIQIALDRKYQADRALAQQIKATATKNKDLNLVHWTDKALAGSATQLDDFLRVGQYDLDLATSFAAGEVLPSWSDTVAWTNGIVNVAGICCKLAGPELGVRTEAGHTGGTSLMYSGLDNNATKSYAYLKSMALSRITVKPSTKLTYWIHPQANTVRPEVKAANSTCVAIDLLFSDGKNLRDSGQKDTRGNRAHPAHQCNKLTVGKWNEVVVPLGALAGKQITTLVVAYDQPAATGGYRGLVDDLTITD